MHDDVGGAKGAVSVKDIVDHLVYATPDLSMGVQRIAEWLGVEPVPGGQHPGRGTRNALVALGPASYLEIVGPESGSGTTVTLFNLRHMGGALARKSPGAGARATLPGEVSLFALGVAPEDEAVQAVQSRIDRLVAAARPHRNGQYPNFVEEPADASTFFDAATWARLRAIKAAYDPQDLFKGNHYIPPAERIEQAAA